MTTLTPGQARAALATLRKPGSVPQSHQPPSVPVGGYFGVLRGGQQAPRADFGEVVDGFLSTVASVKRKTIAEAAKHFIENRSQKTEAVNGKRPQLSACYACNAVKLNQYNARQRLRIVE